MLVVNHLFYIVRWKSALLCGYAQLFICSRALLSPAVFYYPQPCSIIPRHALLSPAVLYYSLSCSIIPSRALLSPAVLHYPPPCSIIPSRAQYSLIGCSLICMACIKSKISMKYF